MAAAKEPSQAFMPSSNDAMYSPAQSTAADTASRNSQFSSMGSNNQSNEYAISSPTHRPSHPQTPSSSRKLSLSTSVRATPFTNGSLLPPSATDGPEPSDGDFWYNLHLQALANFELERATWKKMTERLRHDVDKLKAELDRVARGSPSYSAFYSANGKENDRSNYNEDVRNHAEQKLRQFSVISPRSKASPERITSPTSSGGEKPSRKISSAMRLPSITEHDSTPSTKRVSIAEPSAAEPTVTSASEDPGAPPPTARPQSPHPASYTLDAGHTPRRSSTSRGSRPIALHSQHKRHNIRNNSIVPGFDMTTAANVKVDELEDDRELDSPKMLPTTPSKDKGSNDMLDKLCGKLEEVAEHPDENEPEVLKHDVLDDADGDEVAVEVDEGLLVNGGGGEGQVEVAEDLDKGIKMKARRSLNFGAPLGMSR